jgi:hypothetical protein
MKQKNTSILTAAFALIFAIISLISIQAYAQKKPPATRIGTYDSRIVTFAWSRSDYFMQHMKKLSQQSDSAEKAHDTARVKELSVGMMSYQHLLHQMVFSNGSVGMVMELVKDKLPELAKTAGVSVILSKWELNFSDQAVEITDLTDQVSKLFNPKENIDNMSGEIRKQEPIPLEELMVEGDMLDLYCKRFGGK